MIDKAKALQLARDAFSGSTLYFNANIRAQIEKDIRQFQSRHNPDSKYLSEAYRARSRFYRPKTRAMVRSNEATSAEAFFSTQDVVSVTPEREQDLQQQISAEINQELLQYRLTKTLPWFVILQGAYQDAQVQGVVISREEWIYDPDRGEDRPDVRLIPVENFRFDPAADWLDPVNTSPYLIELIPMYVKDVKAKVRQGRWFPMTDAQLLSSAKLYDSTRMLREDNRSPSTDNVTTINDFTIVWVHLNIMSTEFGDDVMYYTLGTEFLLSQPAPVQDQFAHCKKGKRPYTLGFCVIETHKNYPSGPVRLTRDTAAEINEIANQRIDNVKFAMNKRYFVQRNRQVDIRSLTRNVPSSVTLLTDVEKDVKVIDTPDVTSSSYQEQDRLNMDFDEISGNMSQSSVQANRRLNETVGGMEILSADANKVQAYTLKTFIETWVEPVLRHLVRLEQCYETDEVLLAIAGQKSSLYQKSGLDLGVDQLLEADLTLTCSVGMNATSPTQKINNLLTGINGVKAALQDGILERYGIDPTMIIKEVFGALGHKDGGKFFKSSEDPSVSALRNQVEQLQQQLNAKYPPELLAAQVREINARADTVSRQGDKADADKVAKMVEAIYSAMQAGEILASVPQVAPVADKLMQAAGYQQPTPAGVDPNFPQPLAPAANQAARTGPVDVPESGNTSPMFPARPGTPDAGMNHGIEADGYANGGLIGTENMITGMPGIATEPGPDPRQGLAEELAR